MEREVREKFEAICVDVGPFTGETGNVIIELRLLRETLAVGGKLPVTFTRRVPCETCKGSGRAEGAPACEKCKGDGRISHEVVEGGVTETIVTTCPTCDGRGHATVDACQACERGYTNEPASIDVEVPAGSAVGMQLRVPAQGHRRPDKPQGDVVVVLTGDPSSPVSDKSPAAQKLPSLMVFLVLTVVVLIVALMMGRS